MTGIYIQRDATWSWLAGTESSPASEAAYPVFDDWSLDPELRDVVSNFTAGSIYIIADQIVGKRMAGNFRLPLFQQPDIANTPPVYGALLRMCGMVETDTGSGFSYGASTSTALATDDTAGPVYPKALRLNIDEHAFPLFTNAVGECAFELIAPGLPTLALNFIAQRAAAYSVDAAQPSITHPLHPVPVGSTSITLTRTVPAVTGTATSTGTTTLTDTAGSFLTRGVQPGDVITNSTDGSSGGGVITAVTSETTVTHTALTGGSGNDWQISDEYSIAASPAPAERVTRAYLPLGNQLAERPGIGGVNAYHQPRITDRTSAIYSLDLDMPRRTDFDWQRCIDHMSGLNPTTAFFAVSLTHNSGGATGSVLNWTFSARPFGKASITSGNAGQLMLGLQMRQVYSSGQLLLVVS